jgi:hypothetical protein
MMEHCENSRSSLELVEAYSEGISLDGEQSAPLSGSPIPQAYCAPDKMTDFSRLSRFGMTFKPLTADRGEALLMSYLEAFPVKTFPQQEKAQALKVSDLECGEKWLGWSAKFDPHTSTLRTAQCSLLEEEPELLQTLPRSGMTRSGMLWERQTLVLRTSETESGLLGTPTTSQDFKPIRKLAPSEEQGKHGVILVGSIGNKYPHLIGRYLKPLVTEWLMGWPLGWTDLKPLEMDKFQQWQQQHGEFLGGQYADRKSA